MGCFESYMEFREELEKIKINQKNRPDPLRGKKGASGDLTLRKEIASEFD
jgi:hypothetical protein